MAGRKAILTGSGPGRQLLSALVSAQPSTSAPTPVFLDFEGVEVATASFLRESVIGFRNYCRQSIPNAYPVLANLSADVSEEIEFFIKARGDALWVCDLNARGAVSHGRIIGELEPAQREAFNAAIQLGSVTAATLAKSFSKQAIGNTAWNNRLSALAAKGLLMETRQGKTKSFNPPLENK